MKFVALFASVVGVTCSEEVADESGVSLLQHSARPIRKAEDKLREDQEDICCKGGHCEPCKTSLLMRTTNEVEDPPGPPPPGVAERQARRREQRRQERAAGRGPSDLNPEQIERRRARRRARRQAKRAAQAAGQAHFNDGGTCDTCAAKCTAIFDDEFKDCIIREGCQPWQKEDGPATGKCQRRCDRSANWLREPCIRACQCDVDLIGRDTKVTKRVDKKADWAEGHHRCRSVPLGSMSTCTSIAEHENNPQFDSIKKCAKAAVQSGANTFNFYRTSKEWGKCSLRQCTSGDLQVAPAPPSAEAPAGRGTWKVFSTFCDAPPADAQSDTGADESSR